MAYPSSLPARIVAITAGVALVAGVVSAVGPFPLATKAAAAAPSDAQPGELVAQRTRTSATIRQSDGTLKTTISAGAVHYRDSAGAWKRIDSALAATAEDGFAYRNKANSFHALFKAALGGEHLRVSSGGRDFGLSLEGAGHPSAKAKGNGLVYPHAIGAVDLKYDVLADGVKETLVLPDASSPTTYHFLLSASGDAGMRAERRPDGSWAFFSGAALSPAFVLDAPVAVDADVNGQPSAPTGPNAKLDVRKVGRGFSLTLDLDRTWLKAPERRFPVQLDPTITINPPVEDGSFATTCPGCYPYVTDTISVGSTSSIIWRGALQFDLGGLPAGADITTATLEAYWKPQCLAAGTGFCNGTAHQIDAHLMTTSWGTTTTTSALGYAPTAFASATVTPSLINTPPSWVSWPITTTLRDWQSSTTPNFGVLLKRNTEPLNASGPMFNGRRSGDPTLQPKLVVTYPGDSVNLFPPTTLHSDGADLRWSAYPNPSTTPFTGYQVHRSTWSGFTPDESTRLTTVTDRSVTSFRDTTAAAGRSFTYKVVTGTRASSGRTVKLPALGQATKILQPTADEGSATTIASFQGMVNCAGYSAESLLQVGPQSDATKRALVRFDLRDIPADATISKAVFSAWHPYRIDMAQTVRAFPVTAEWHEGTALSTCSRDSVTWYESYGGVPWAVNGGDATATAAATVAHAGGELPAFDNFDVTGVASQWASGAMPNHGLMLRQDQETPGTGSLLQYHSDDFSVSPSLRPKLVVTYTDGSRPVRPTVSMAAPLPGAVSGVVSLTAAATDDRRVDEVEFYIDGAWYDSVYSAPFTLYWNSTNDANGSHTLSASAIDDAGNVTTSKPVQVVLDNSAPPTTNIDSPIPPPPTLSYVKEILADAPVAWWRLGEAQGAQTVADETVYGRDGRAVGTPTFGAKGAVGDGNMAMQANPRSDDYVSVPADSQWATTTSFSLEWWGAPLKDQSSVLPGFMISGRPDVTGDGWGISWDVSGKVVYKRDNREYASGTALQGGPAIATDPPTYHHYVLTYDKTALTLRWYVDGQAALAHPGVSFAAWNGASHPLLLGRGEQSSALRIDEPMVYDKALTASRITDHYKAGTASSTAVAGTVPVMASAADDRAVTRVEFYADGVRYAEDTTTPYQASWNTLDPAAPVADGVHVLTTKAYDSSGQVTTSAAVPVSVGNTKNTPYVATIGSSRVPELMQADPAATHGVDVFITNDSDFVFYKNLTTVQYSWVSHDAAPVTTVGTSVPLTGDLAPGRSQKVRLNIAAPVLPDGVEQAAYTLVIDLKDNNRGTTYAAKGNKPAESEVQVARSLEDTLGLERWHEYRGSDLGAGVQNLVDVASGNNLWRWTPSESPGLGLSTVVDLTYNSLEKSSPSPVGPGVSLSISSLSRFGLPIDIHPNKADSIDGNANRYVVFTDGDGTTHRFDGVANADGTYRYEAPPGVHLYLRPTGSTDPARAWAFSRPDRVTYYYDADGYPTLVEDANGNRITYTLEQIPPGEDGGPVKKRITAVTDAGGRSYRLDYWSKDEVKKAQVRGKLQRLTDHSGSAWDFDYYEDGNLRVITQRGGTKADGSGLADRRVVFTYTTSNGDAPAISDPALRADPDPRTPNQSALVYSIRDPRGAETRFSYYGPGSSQLRGRINTVTDRAGAVTTYTYDLAARTTTAAAPLSRTDVYTWDTLGRATTLRNALGQDTTLTWNGDNKVVTLTEPTGRTVKYTYNANGYLTSTTDQLDHTTLLEMEDVAADANDVSGKWESGRTIPHYSQLKYKTSPRGTATAAAGDYRWTFNYDARGNLIATIDPSGAKQTLTVNPNGTLASVTDARGVVSETYSGYDPNGFPGVVTDGLARKTRLGYNSDGNLLWIQDAKHASATGSAPRDYRTYFDYDAFGRMGRQSTPKSTDTERGLLIWSGADFDANDNTILDVDQHYGQQYSPGIAFQTQHDFDAMDRETLATAMDTSADPAGERTSATYDAAGRLTRQTRPLGVKSTTIANDHTVEFSYDLLDRTVRTAAYEVDTAGVQQSVKYTHTCYDLAGDAVRSIAPRADRATVSCADDTVPFMTKTSYDAAHRPISVTDAAGRVQRTGYDENDNVISRTDQDGNVETTEFDQRDLPIKTVQPFTGGPTPRLLTTLLEYDANGNRSRVITPRAFDASSDKTNFTSYVTRYVYDAANQLTRTDFPSTGAGDQHYKHTAYDAVGNLVTVTQDVAQPALADVAQNQREDRSYFDSGWIRTSDNHVDPVLHYDYDAAGRQTSRTPEKKGVSELNLAERQEYRYEIDGMLRERSDSGGQKVTYTYDADNVTRGIKDASGARASRQRTMEVQITTDGLDRPVKSRQRKEGETRWKATVSSFDLNDNLKQRIDDREEDDGGAQLKAGRQNDYTFDGTDRLTQQLDQGKDTQASTDDDTRIRTTYFPQGWESQRTTDKYVPGGSPVWQPKKVQDWTYYDNGQLKTMSTKNGDGTVLESHDLTYTDGAGRYVNGNQTADTFKRSSPVASTPCSSETCTARFTYDARDRLVHQESGGGGSADYTLDPAGNIAKEIQAGSSGTTTTTYTYRGPQLDTATDARGTTKSHYDTHGNLDCTTGATGTDADCNTPGGWQTDYSYDGLDRFTGYKEAGGLDTTYEYDALDRQTRQQEKHGSTAAARITNFSHLGLTNKVTKEEQSGDDGSVSRTKEYSYDAYGRANGMTDTLTGQAPQKYSYGKDPLGSVSQLIDESGKAAAAYGYKPYGDTDKSLSAGDTDPENPRNPVRFTEKRYDSGSSTIDMGVRRFGPSNRFLQEDRFADALSDLDLSLDPLTANRYNLAGGNPANFVEVDGHFSISDVVGDAEDAVSDAADDVGDAVEGAAEDVGGFIEDHAVDIAAIGAGAACGYFTAGLAATACAGAVNAAAGAYHAAKDCGGKGASCYVKSMAVNTASGAAGGAVTKLAGAAVTRTAGRTATRAAEAESSSARTAASACSVNSFTAGTPVLMADGTQKPIEQVREGDLVMATDPETGVTAAEAVVTPIAHGGPHTMVTVSLSDGSSITATDEHPFWDETEHAFVNAQDLHTGDKVLTDTGKRLLVKAIAVFAAVLVAFNLQIDQIHTYYAGATPVLVHNACGSSDYRGRFNADLESQGKKRLPRDWDAHHRIPQVYRDHPEFQDFDFHAPSNIRGLQNRHAGPGNNVHSRVTTVWGKFRRQNPHASRRHVERFANQVDRGYGGRYWGG